MSGRMGKSYWPLVVVTLLVVAAATWLASRKSATTEASAERWLPGLRGDLDRVTRVRLSGAGNKTLATIEQKDAGFVVVERGGYPADTAALRKLLLQLADARRLEAKTARPEQHAALGVESVAGVKSTGVLVTIEGPPKPRSVTIGRTADQLGGGTFVRTGSEPQSWLVNGNIVVEREPQRWLEKRIADIPAVRIERIEVARGDERFALVPGLREPAAPGPIVGDKTIDSESESEKIDEVESDAFVIEGVSADLMASPFAAAATADALSALDLEDVRTRNAAEGPARDATRLRFDLRTGVSVVADAWQEGGKTLLQLSAEVTPVPAPIEAALGDRVGRTDPVDATRAAADEPASSVDPKGAVAAATAAAAFNRQWQGWTYVVPTHRSAGLLPKRSALLKPTSR